MAASGSAATRQGAFSLATASVDGEPVPSVMVDGRVSTLSALLSADAPADLRDMLVDLDAWCDHIVDRLRSDGGVWVEASTVTFMPPITAPPTIYCAGANYRDHVQEMGHGLPETPGPFHFLLPPAALTGHRHTVRAPGDVDCVLDWEVELVIVIGKQADGVAEDQALSHVAGYTIANDISLRDRSPTGRHQIFGNRWLETKGRKTFLPVGPGLVPSRFVPDPMNLDLGLDVDGAPRQASNTGQMLWSVAAQISYLSALVPLVPGDLILTGTPAGTAAAHGTSLVDGSRMVAWIQGLGELENTIAVIG